jgi:hypothetical protein
MTLGFTLHAVQRARERRGIRPDLELAVRLPDSLRRRMRHEFRDPRPTIRYYATASLILVVAKRHLVVTCMELDVEDLAEVLVDLLFRSSRWA